VGPLVGRRRAVRPLHPQPLDLGGDVEVRLGPEEEPVPRLHGAPPEYHVLTEGRLRRAGGEPEVAATALRVEPGRHRDRLDQRGLPAAVLPHQERHPRCHGEPTGADQPRHGRQVERIPEWRTVQLHTDAVQEPRRSTRQPAHVASPEPPCWQAPVQAGRTPPRRTARAAAMCALHGSCRRWTKARGAVRGRAWFRSAPAGCRRGARPGTTPAAHRCGSPGTPGGRWCRRRHPALSELRRRAHPRG